MARQDDLAIELVRPASAGHAEAGDLDRRVRARGEQAQRALPAGDACGAAIGGQARVIEHQRRAGERAAQRGRVGQLGPRRLQVEAKSEARQQRVARAPARVAHRAGPRLVADAAHESERRLPLEHGGDVVAVEPGLRHHHRRESRLASQPLDPGGLAQGVARVPFGFHIHRFHHLVRARVREVVGGEVRPAQRRVIAVAERDRRLIAEPRMVVGARIPEMLVRVDDRKLRAHAGILDDAGAGMRRLSPEWCGPGAVARPSPRAARARRG